MTTALNPFDVSGVAGSVSVLIAVRKPIAQYPKNEENQDTAKAVGISGAEGGNRTPTSEETGF